MADYLPPVVAKLTGDDSGLTRTLAASKDKVRRWAVEVGKTKVTLTVDAKLKDGTLAELRRRVADSPAAKLRVDLQLGTGQREALRQSLADREVQVKVKPVMDSLALRRVQTVLMELGRRIDVQVRPVMDDGSQRRAQARLDRLSANRTVTIRTRVIGGGSTAGNARSDAGALSTLISLAPALVPVAASAASVAASVGAATVAVGAFGLAVLPQIKSLGAAADAQKKYTAAVTKYGPASQQTAAAQEALSAALDGMPPATQRAAMGFLGLKNTFKSWSDGLSQFTMQPVLHSFALAEGILPRLSPMVKGVSGELDRLVTVAAGGMQTPGFDRLMSRFTAFADGALKHGVDDVIHFSRVLSEGGGGRGAVAEFMAYAKAEGPQVRETLTNISHALATILKGSAAAGPGMLSVVNAVAKLVAALPPEFVGRAMQVYAALKLYKLASSGVTSVAGSVTNLSTRLAALRATSVAAGGGVAGVRAALASLSTGAKIGGAITVIAGVALALHSLADNSKAAPDVDKMTTALGEFGRTGKVTGVLKGDLKDLSESIAMVSKSASDNKFVKAASDLGTWLGVTNGPSVSDAKKNVDSLDKSLAALVQGGHADEAAAANKRLERAWIAGGGTAKRYAATMNDYRAALDDVKFQSELTAESQGAFGVQAQAVQKKLDAQKRAAQGLQQAILDLNDANRQALDSESDYQQAIDDATAAIKGHGKALKFTNGSLDLNSQKAREAYGALSKLSSAAEANATAVLQQTGSQDKANRVLIDAHARLISVAQKMGLSTREAHKFADSLDNIKDPKIQVTVSTMAAEANLARARAKVNSFPKRARTDANFAYQRALSDLRYYQHQVDLLHGKTIAVNVVTHTSGGTVAHEGGGYADGAVVSGHVRRMAEGGMGRPAMMAHGGSNVLWAEGGDESYIPHDRRPRSRSIAERTVALMGGSVSWGGSGGGSPASSTAPLGAQVAKGLWAGMSGQAAWLAAQAKRFALQTIPRPMADALGINSPSKVAMSLGRWVGAGMVQGLTGSTASVKSATLRLSRSIEQVFHDDAQRQIETDKKQLASLAGAKGKKAASKRADLRADIRYQQHLMDSGIARFVEVDNARLLRLAARRDTVAGKLKAAQTKLADLRKSWTDERNSIASGIMQGASIITASPSEARSVNATDVVTQMRQRVAAALQFAAELEQLRKKGLRSDLIEQLSTAGVDQGGATALALSAGSKGQIAEMNRLQSGLKSTANAAGSTVADAMFGAGIKSAEGLVKGLKSQEKAIEAQMMRIARSMQAAIRKALGIRSPSTVMAELGDYTARGYAVGIDRSAKHAVIAARGMAMAVRQGAAVTGGPIGGGAASPVVHVHVTVQGSVVTEKQLVESVRTGLVRGGLRNANVGLTPRR